ncbi:MAG: protein kinase, partial [Deltaproteobacteria bacterium]|nr:protein kinase [Deltaproteobacteria bacterium]
MDDRLDATLPSVPVPPGAGASERPARDRVGPYRVQTVLGRGGMGVVYGALDERGARVAVKTMRAGVVRAAAVARFAREASLRIEHENVVRVLDAGVDPDGTPYIAFEWLEGEAFAQRLARARPSEADARDVVAQACAGLAVVHAAGIVHRDLKPANLFCCSDGVVKVLDFGVARVAEAATLTSEGAVLGTLSYLSPEQAQSRRDVDARTDVWALGVVLYEALSGVLPFDRESPVGTLLAIVEDPPRPLRELAPEVSAHVADVVHACLAKRPDERLSSVSALAAALDDAARGRAVAIPPPAAADAPVPPPAIRAGEQRIVAALLARGVRDMALVEHEVGARGGRLVELLAGAAIGVFGAGSWDGEEAARAVSAAVACRHACERVAVASGWARATERGIAGGAVETAEHGCARRLAGVAVDVHTARALGDRFAIEASSDGWHEVLAERPAGWLARHAAPVAELVGRRRELDALSRELREVVVSGAARGVVLVGPTGIGKSAIRRVLELHAPDAGATFVLTGRGEQASRDVSLSLFLSALRRRATRLATAYGAPRLDVRAPPMERLAAVRGLLREAVQDPTRAREMTEILAERMALDAPGVARDADGSRLGQLAADRAHLAMLDYVAGLARRGPTTLLLEDLQWADPASLALVAELLHHLHDAPLFVFATARAWPEALGSGEATGPRGNVARWELGGLAPDAVRELATRVAGCAPSDAVMAALVARTEGNPLFVEQITLELAERGALRTNDPLAIALPLTVEAALQSRLDL